MSKFIVGKQYKLVDANKGDRALAHALAVGVVAFPDDGIFTCHSLGRGNETHLAHVVAYSHTKGIVNKTYEPDGDIPCAYQEDLEAGIFEEVE
jgi:hypothetical protein